MEDDAAFRGVAWALIVVIFFCTLGIAIDLFVEQ
jgi:uncharacterized membrane protein